MRARWAAAAAVSAVLLAACGIGGATGGPTAPPRPGAAPSGSATSGASGAGTSDAIVLRADLSERPPAWTQVALLPFGPQPERLGYRTGHQTATAEPASFSVARDGSMWVLDAAKQRVVHFSAGGTFLGAVEGLGSLASDMAPFRGGVAVVDGRGTGRVALVTGNGRIVSTTTVRRAGKPLYVANLMPVEDWLLASLAGFAGHLPAGPKGFARLRVPASGAFRLLDGVPVGRGNAMDVASAEAGGFDVRYIGPDGSSVRPFRVDVRQAGRHLNGGAGPAIEARAPHALFLYVMVIGDAGTHSVGGRWLLKVANDGSPLLWERLPDPTVDDAWQVRHLAVGPDGRLYLMVLRRSGVAILRR